MNPARAVRPEVIGHGGAGAYHPLNSAASIESALALGVDRVELDVRRSADGILVLVHDARLTMPGGSVCPVSVLTLTELGEAVPGLLTLDEAADLIGNRAAILLDAKSPGLDADLSGAIRRHGWAESAVVASTHASTLRRLRGRFDRLRLGLSTGHWAGSAPGPIAEEVAARTLRIIVPPPLIAVMTAIGATETMLHHRVASRALVRILHGRGWRVSVWTVDDSTALRHAIDLGVDGVVSNRPDLVRAALNLDAVAHG